MSNAKLNNKHLNQLKRSVRQIKIAEKCDNQYMGNQAFATINNIIDDKIKEGIFEMFVNDVSSVEDLIRFANMK